MAEHHEQRSSKGQIRWHTRAKSIKHQARCPAQVGTPVFGQCGALQTSAIGKKKRWTGTGSRPMAKLWGGKNSQSVLNSTIAATTKRGVDNERVNCGASSWGGPVQNRNDKSSVNTGGGKKNKLRKERTALPHRRTEKTSQTGVTDEERKKVVSNIPQTNEKERIMIEGTNEK